MRKLRVMGRDARKRKVIPAEERFWDKVNKRKNGCWEWAGAINKYGYGSFRGHNSKDTKSHIFSYELHKGEISTGLQLDHLCRNRSCCNPEHLEAVTVQENQNRGVPFRAARTHCVNGHPLTDDNIIITNKNKYPGKKYKICKTCRQAKRKMYKVNLHKKLWLEGFKAGIDAKSCCCNNCTLHSLAVEEKVSNELFHEEG
jgi:hypothetical protein